MKSKKEKKNGSKEEEGTARPFLLHHSQIQITPLITRPINHWYIGGFRQVIEVGTRLAFLLKQLATEIKGREHFFNTNPCGHLQVLTHGASKEKWMDVCIQTDHKHAMLFTLIFSLLQERYPILVEQLPTTQPNQVTLTIRLRKRGEKPKFTRAVQEFQRQIQKKVSLVKLLPCAHVALADPVDWQSFTDQYKYLSYLAEILNQLVEEPMATVSIYPASRIHPNFSVGLLIRGLTQELNWTHIEEIHRFLIGFTMTLYSYQFVPYFDFAAQIPRYNILFFTDIRSLSLNL